MDAPGPEHFALIRGALSALRLDVARYVADQPAGPAPGSRAAAELAEAPGPGHVASAWTRAHFLIEAGNEHIAAFVKTITPPAEDIACWTCVRSMLEPCALAAWLVDPDSDARTRIGRVLALRYEGLCEERKVMRAAGVGTEEIDDISRAIEHLEAEAVAMGFDRLVDRGGRRSGIGLVMPSATDVIGGMLGEEVLYRVLSAITHGHEWAVHNFAFRESADPPGPAPHVGGVRLVNMTKSADPYCLSMLAIAAATSWMKPLWHHARYLGRDEPRLVTLFDETAKRLRMADEVRFWKW